jgi:hypothetical protein
MKTDDAALMAAARRAAEVLEEFEAKKRGAMIGAAHACSSKRA